MVIRGRKRYGACGGWTWSWDTQLCHLHSRTSCCFQKSQLKADSSKISGFSCPTCWATDGGCPCSDDPNDNFSLYHINGVVSKKFGSGATEITETTATAVITTHRGRITATLACTWVQNKRRQWRCLPACPNVNRRGKCAEDGQVKTMDSLMK